jgi:hypothetical protein
MRRTYAQPESQTAACRSRRLGLALLICLLVASTSLGACNRGDGLSAAAIAAQRSESSPLDANAVLLPSQLGKVRARAEAGSRDKPLVFLIGENHVSVPVQRAAADLLGYLVSAYDLKLVCAEGFSGPLPRVAEGLPLRATRDTAEALLAARQIRAVEHAALFHPDLKVVGVEDMDAYRAHQHKLHEDERRAAESPEHKRLANDLRQFLTGLSLGQEQLGELKAVGDRANKTCDIDAPLRALLDMLGPRSADGIRLTALLQQRDAWQAAERQRLRHQPPDPLLERRNQALVERSLATAGDAASLALVVGSLHVPGIEQELRQRGVPFVSVLAAGIGDDLVGPSDSSDACIYQRLSDGWQSDLEKALSRVAPPPSLFRPAFRDQVATLSALANADLMLSQGVPESEVLQLTRPAAAVRVVRVFAVAGGHGMEIEHDGESTFVYFGATAAAVTAGAGVEPLEAGNFGGRHFAAYGSGGGRQPPIPPTGAAGPVDPGDFGHAIQRAVVVRDQTSRDAVAVSFIVVGGEVVRLVDGRHSTPLGIQVAAAAAAVQSFRQARSGPDKLYAAQQLAGMLLVDIDRQIPAGKSRLQQISAGDFLGNLSLPYVAKLAHDPGSKRLGEIAETYTLPWDHARRNLEALSRAPARAMAATTVVWIADDLKTSAAGQQAVRSIAATGVRVNELPRRGDALILLGAQARNWVVTLKGDSVPVTASDARLLQAVRAAGSVVALNVELPQGVSGVAKELRAQALPGAQALDLVTRIAQVLEKQGGEASLDRLLREATAEQAERARDELRKRATLDGVEAAVASAMDIHSTATIAL